MRSFVAIFTAIALSFPLKALPSCLDTLKMKELDTRLELYFRTLETETAEVKNKECDLLVKSASDPQLRQRIALKVYDHYFNSPVMGDEAVAVHFTDTWFATGKIEMNSGIDLMNARIFADFNRQSLLGETAPSLELFDPDSAKIQIGGPAGRFRVLFFYDTDCSKCKLETMMLRSLLNDKNYPIDFYAIYTGDDPESWRDWRESKFHLGASEVKVHDLWDPGVSSDYQMKYGVIQTPRMFLLDRRGVIIGRGLDSEALSQLLDIVLSEDEYEYGGARSVSLFDSLFSSYGDSLSAEDVLSVAGTLKERTLDRRDTLSFKHLEGDLLYYLSSKRSEVWSEGSLLFLNEYVLRRADIWNTPQDSLQIIGLAQMMDGLLSRTPVGSRIPKEPIKGWNRLRRRGGYILFHTEGCSVCETEMSVADSLRLNYISVDVDNLMDSEPELARTLFDTFDLSSLPYVIEISRRGIVKRKYVSIQKTFER